MENLNKTIFRVFDLKQNASSITRICLPFLLMVYKDMEDRALLSRPFLKLL